jgi:hypothetical protein
LPGVVLRLEKFFYKVIFSDITEILATLSGDKYLTAVLLKRTVVKMLFAHTPELYNSLFYIIEVLYEKTW